MAVSKTLKNIFGVAAAGSAVAAVAFGPVSFGAPNVLWGAAALPALWWLLRTVPPKPLLEKFPAISLLFNLESKDQEPARMPLWHRLICIGAATAVIGGLAEPRLNPDKPLEGTGPVMLVVDNDWAAARNWQTREAEMEILIDRAARENRPVIILPTAAPKDGGPVAASGPHKADEARRIADALEPQPWPADRKAAAGALDAITIEGTPSVVWLSNGLDDENALSLTHKLQTLGTLTVVEDDPSAAARIVSPPDASADSLSVTVRRLDGTKEDILSLTASTEDGRAIDQVQVQMKPGETQAQATFSVPQEMRNELTRIAIDGENTAGATVLLDERWRRRPVGLLQTGTTETAQALLSETGYVERALGPYVDLHQGSVDEVLKEKLAVLVMTDGVALNDAARRKVEAWVEEGGTLLRFAGPRLAAQERGKDKLLPVELRPGERVLAGKLSGAKPGRLAPFEQDSPFRGIKQPQNVTIEREVLAQPGLGLDEKTWAKLDDGTPLVTAAPRGKGQVVLVHTTANTEWSNLVLSGAFVDMMRAVVSNSQGVSGPDNAVKSLPPVKTLDAKGSLSDPAPSVRALTPDALASGTVNAQNPPGFYGDDSVRQAHNLASAVPELKPLSAFPEGVRRDTYDVNKETNLAGIMLGAAFALLLIDMVVLLGQQGLLRFRKDQEEPVPVPPAVPKVS